MSSFITYGIHPTPCGKVFIVLKATEVCKLAFISTKKDEKVCLKELQQKWSEVAIKRDQGSTEKIVKDIFSISKSKKKSIGVAVSGTDFQMKVWQALRTIPAGKVASYSEIAQKIKSPKAVRAVGTACGANQIAFLIPCHRILTSEGKIGGYRWGIERKKELLAREGYRGILSGGKVL